MKQKAWCGGTLCRKSDRKQKCLCCGLWVCGGCSAKFEKDIFCVDCYVEKRIDELIIILSNPMTIKKRKKTIEKFLA